jgi:hypothetical protein
VRVGQGRVEEHGVERGRVHQGHPALRDGDGIPGAFKNAIDWLVAGTGKVFDDGGAIVDATVRTLLEAYVTGFARFVAKQRRVQ